MSDKYEPPIYRGCKNCPNAPQTYEEYCLSKCCPEKICPDAYTEVAYHCGNYEHTATEERELNELKLIPRYKGHWIKHHNDNLGRCMRDTLECSVCGKRMCDSPYQSFCPSCGADMRGDK